MDLHGPAVDAARLPSPLARRARGGDRHAADLGVLDAGALEPALLLDRHLDDRAAHSARGPRRGLVAALLRSDRQLPLHDSSLLPASRGDTASTAGKPSRWPAGG